MPAPYNMTGIDSAVGIAETYKAVADLAPAYLGNSIVATFFTIAFVAMISLNIRPQIALFTSSTATAFVSIILFYFGLVGTIAVGVTIAMSVGTAIWLAALGD